MPTPADPSAPIAYRRRPTRFRRGAAILPSLFTTGNLFLGFWAVVKTLHGEYQEAAPLIGWAIILDLLVVAQDDLGGQALQTVLVLVVLLFQPAVFLVVTKRVVEFRVLGHRHLPDR